MADNSNHDKPLKSLREDNEDSNSISEGIETEVHPGHELVVPVLAKLGELASHELNERKEQRDHFKH